MTKLKELLTEGEIILFSQNVYESPVETNVADLTVNQLFKIGMVLIEPDYFGMVRQLYVPAKAIEILLQRAQENNLAIF
jgi:hypothetical protein